MSKQYLLSLSLLCLVLFACSDFTEEDLENDTLDLLGPADGTSTEIQTLTFWWDAVKGADKYRLQIAEPNFDEIVRLELDTLISTKQFEHTLFPGDFEWRVRAENSAYTTDYFSRLLNILEPIDITKQKVVLVSPGKESNLNAKQVEFDWNEMSIAHEYQFELHQSDWSGEDVIDAKLLSDTKLTLELEEGTYAWGVLARDTVNNEETPFTYRNLVVDLTAPNQPTLSAPADNASVTGLKQSMSWTHQEDNELTDIVFFIQIFSDQNLTTLLDEEELKSKQNEYSFSSTGTYYWRVKALDEAGNESDYTTAYSFTIANE
nr:hypothetical protein [uncultured Marinifilum sp.]